MLGTPKRKAVGTRLYRFLLALALFVVPYIGFAQSAALTGSGSTIGAVRFQILDQRRVWFGQHSITFNRVAPPVFAVAVSTPTPASANPLPASVTNCALLFFSAAVYDHQFTVLQRFDWNDGMVAVSNIDFNYFTTNGGFIEGNTFYENIMALDNESSSDADPTTAAWLAQARQELVGRAPAYVIVTGSATVDQVQELEDLHTYFADNSSGLIEAYRREQAQNAARLLQMKLHPPLRPNTVINYWPIKSSVYPTGSNQ